MLGLGVHVLAYTFAYNHRIYTFPVKQYPYIAFFAMMLGKDLGSVQLWGGKGDRDFTRYLRNSGRRTTYSSTFQYMLSVCEGFNGLNIRLI